MMVDLRARLPERTLTVALLRRGAVLWLLARVTLMILGVVVAGTLSPRRAVRLSIPAAVAFILVVGALGFLEARRRNEDHFLANLGVSPLIMAMLLTAPALAFELALAAVALR